MLHSADLTHDPCWRASATGELGGNGGSTFARAFPCFGDDLG